MPSLTKALPGSASDTLGLVVTDVGRFIVGIPIHAVSYILTRPVEIEVPRPRPFVRSLMNYEHRLVPVVDLRERLEQERSTGADYVVLVRERERVFGFPIGYIESVTQIPVERIRYPRDEEIAIDRHLVRGYWNYSGRRHGYIMNCAALHDDIVGSPGTAAPTNGSEETV